MTVVCPKGYEPQKSVVDECIAQGRETGSRILVTDDAAAVKGADVIYTDVWASMGQEKEHAERLRIFKDYQINAGLMAKTGKKDTLFMHCLPAHRGEEVTDEVVDSPNSVVFDEAENRLHAQKAILVSLMAGHEGMLAPTPPGKAQRRLPLGQRRGVPDRDQARGRPLDQQPRHPFRSRPFRPGPARRRHDLLGRVCLGTSSGR